MPETQVAIKGNVDKPLVEIDTSAGEVDVQLPEKKSEQDVEIKDDQTVTTVDSQLKLDKSVLFSSNYVNKVAIANHYWSWLLILLFPPVERFL